MAHPTSLVLDQQVPESSELMTFRKRKAEQMTEVEKHLLQTLPQSSMFYLHYPPFFHENLEVCGEELHAGFVMKWSTFIIVETLLSAMAIQPLVSVVSIEGWKRDVFGMLWMLTLVWSILGLIGTALCLGYLLHCPRKLAWIWFCKVGLLSKLPILIMRVSSFLGLFAIVFSTWILYGPKVGLPCLAIVVGGLGNTLWLKHRLADALQDAYMLDGEKSSFHR